MPADLADLFRQTIEKHRLVHPGDRVLAAVSGGADSVALLHLLRDAAPAFSFALEAAHLDHALRPESRNDAEFVHRLCREWQIPLTVERIDVGAAAKRQGVGVEEAGRDSRRSFLQETARRRECRVIALGHHRGDQAETVLHRLLRGSGVSGLAGMEPARGDIIRPLLGVTAQEIRRHLEAKGIAWVEDASNASPVFTRNRIRHELLPHLARFNPRIEEGLARLGRRLALEEDYWRQEAGLALSRLSRPADDGLRLDRPGVLALHPALQVRILRQALRDIRGDLRGVTSAHLELLHCLLISARPQADLHLPGTWAGVRYAELWLRSTPPPVAEGFLFTVPGPGTVALPGGTELSVSLDPLPRGEGVGVVEFDPTAAPFPLTVRSFRPGDRIRPSGMNGRKKVKEILMEAKVEREGRPAIPLVESSEILWIMGIRRCEGRRPSPAGPVLRLSFRPSGG